MAGRKVGFKVPKKPKVCVDCSATFLSAAIPQVRCSLCRKIQLSEIRAAEFTDNMTDSRWRLNKLLAMARGRAKKVGVPFDLDLPFLVDLWEQSGGTCAVTKRKFELDRSEKGKVNPNAPSVDRIVPTNGYVKGNVRLVVYHLNVALSEFGLAEFQQLAKDCLGVAYS